MAPKHSSTSVQQDADTPGPQSKQSHAWLPPQIVQSRPAIQLLPAKAPGQQSLYVIYLCMKDLKIMCWSHPHEQQNCNNMGTYFDYLWLCPFIKRYWRNIRKGTPAIFHVEIKIQPGLFLLRLHSWATRTDNKSFFC